MKEMDETDRISIRRMCASEKLSSGRWPSLWRDGEGFRYRLWRHSSRKRRSHQSVLETKKQKKGAAHERINSAQNQRSKARQTSNSQTNTYPVRCTFIAVIAITVRLRYIRLRCNTVWCIGYAYKKAATIAADDVSKSNIIPHRRSLLYGASR